MAKRKRKSTTKAVQKAAPAPVTVIQRRSSPARRGRGRIAGAAARAGAVARARAKENSHHIFSILGATLLGVAESMGWADKVPQLPGIGAAGTIGGALYAGGHFLKNDKLKAAGMGQLHIAAYRLGNETAASFKARMRPAVAPVSGTDYSDIGRFPQSAAMPGVSGSDYSDIGRFPQSAAMPGGYPSAPQVSATGARILTALEAALSGQDDDDE